MLRSFRQKLFCFVLKIYFSLPQLFVMLLDILSVAVFVLRNRFVKRKVKKKKKKPTCA